MVEIEQIKEQLISFLHNEIFDSSIQIKVDTDLFESGFDSFSLVKLLVFIEKQYSIQVPEDRLTEDTLRNVNRLSELIYAFQEN
ncbi:MAG: acyl carrier protein [Deltaproteobacteria bacterium]|nr:MAG: acyl carrier protein [Deltaproteobacteria bacterium]